MELKIEPLDIHNNEIISALLKWENDEELYHLTIPKKEDCVWTKQNFESLKKKYTKNSKNTSAIYIIFDRNKPIGNYSLQMNPDRLLKKGEETSWPGLTIGEKEYWGKNVASFAMGHFEKESTKKGAIRVELGTFEFNYRAQSFYKRMGFTEIGRLENFTYWNGKYWDDIRMEKYLI